MIKPHAVEAKNSGKIIDIIEAAGFKIVLMEKMQLTKGLAEQFYAEHAERPFFGGLVERIASGPIIAMVLEKENAVQEWRDFIGVTNPTEAAEGTIRKIYGNSLDENAVHGSDADASAERETSLVFSQ
jgi:nucleoside-diphosphate kinase